MTEPTIVSDMYSSLLLFKPELCKLENFLQQKIAYVLTLHVRFCLSVWSGCGARHRHNGQTDRQRLPLGGRCRPPGSRSGL